MKIHMKEKLCRQKEDAEVLGMIFLHRNKTLYWLVVSVGGV